MFLYWKVVNYCAIPFSQCERFPTTFESYAPAVRCFLKSRAEASRKS